MGSPKENVADELHSAMKELQCTVLVLREIASGDPAFIVVFHETATISEVREIEQFAKSGTIPSKAVAVVDMRGDMVTLMVAVAVDEMRKKAIVDTVFGSLRRNGRIGPVCEGVVKPDGERKDLN